MIQKDLIFTQNYEAELVKLKELVGTLPESFQQLLEPTLENLAWLKAKLDETRTILESEIVVIQTERGLSKHPGFDAYSQLLDRYMRATKQLMETLEKIKAPAERKGTALEQIEKRRSARSGRAKANKKGRSGK